MQTSTEQTLRGFFDAYAARFNAALKPPYDVDTAGMTAAFAPYFVESSPVGVQGGKNGLLFRLLLPRGLAHYKAIGTTSMDIGDLQITPIDGQHYMCRVHWDSRYVRVSDDTAQRIEFDNIYFVRVGDEGPKIFAFITGDEEAVLKQHGLV